MANVLEDYLAQLRAGNTAYTPLSDAQIEAKAKQRYQALYDQNRLSAQQTYDAEQLAREQALASTLEQYELQRQQSAENYRNAQADAVRSALGRGMQRSSYLGATVGNIGIKGNEAQQAINKNQEGTIKNYASQQQLAASQLAAQLAQYDKAQMAEQLAYMDELEAREYDRAQTSADRQLQIATDIYNAQLYATQNNLFGYSKYPTSTSTTSSASSSGSGSSSSSPKDTNSTTGGLDAILGALNKPAKSTPNTIIATASAVQNLFNNKK